MKKLILHILAIYTIFMMVVSCSEDFLDTKPVTTLTEADFYKTINDARKALVGCYDGLQRIDGNYYAFPVVSEFLADYAFAGVGASDDYKCQIIDEFDINRSPGEVNIFDEVWKSYYFAIYRINKLLQYIDNINWGDSISIKNQIISEIRFLRAYLYFDLVRLFEKVPLVTTPVTGVIPQSEPDETYKLIADDLLFATEYGDSIIRPGRANKWAAKALLARVYLFYTGYYNKPNLVNKVTKEQALSGLEDIINSGKYELIPEYKDLWPAASTKINNTGDGLVSTYAGKDNKETIFAIKHNITSDYNGNTDGNHWLVMVGLRQQKNNFSPYGKGWGGVTVLPTFYNSFEIGDKRRDASIIAIQEEGLNFDISDQREYTGYTNKKYTPLAMPNGRDLAEYNGAVNFMIGQYQDYVAIRYADVLLMAAELGSSKAQEYYDMVRQRAGLSPKEVTIKNILEERRYEFAFEGICYWDLLRQGLDVAAAAVDITMEVKSGGKPEIKRIKGENLLKTRGFQQIPKNQITLSNFVIKQNQGW